MFRASLCVFCSNFLLFDFMCMRLPFMPWSIAGVPSSQALPGFPSTAPPSVLVPAVPGALVVWIRNQNKTVTGGFQRPWDHSIREILPSLRTCTNLMRPNELWTCPDDGAIRSQAPGCQRSSCGSVRRGRGEDRCCQQRS